MPRYHVDSVLSAGGWLRDVTLEVSSHGLITSLTADTAAAQAERIDGILVPGIANAHSHAFQRAMAGDSEFRTLAHESFWTWREAMYALANGVQPEELELIATQLFIEMLKAGYTSVAEFHYLHRRTDGSAYESHNALWQAIDAAATTAGIALTLLPTLYLSSDFGAQALRRGAAPLSAQRAMSSCDAIARRRSTWRPPRRLAADRRRACTACAPCRSRACARRSRALRAIDADGVDPHSHVAEQLREVRACQEATGRRPIELLLDTGLPDEHWCLVHATHATAPKSPPWRPAGASVCVCPSTEGNLGDGFFDAARLLSAGGRLCIGSDSQATRRRGRRAALARIPAAPATTASCGAREPSRAARRRAPVARERHVPGRAPWDRPAGTIEVGRRADWLVLDALIRRSPERARTGCSTAWCSVAPGRDPPCHGRGSLGRPRPPPRGRGQRSAGRFSEWLRRRT